MHVESSFLSHNKLIYLLFVTGVAGEWLVGAAGDGVLQEDRQEGEQEDEEGVKVKRVYRRREGGQEDRKIGR